MRTNEQMKEWAESQGCTFEVADDKTLFIDIDSKEALEVFKENIRIADNLFGIDRRSLNVKITPSKSGGDKKHIRVGLPKAFSLLERVLLQACLGSDLKRELISMKRVLNKEENVVVFFEKKVSTE